MKHKRPAKKYRRGVIILTAAALLLAFNPLSADEDGEKAALARIAHELDALLPIVQQAETQANKDQRVQFEYNWLRQDIARLRAGIVEYINTPRIEPRSYEPLSGDYRR